MNNIQTSSSHRDVRLLIPAGGTINPNYKGQFVYVKEAAQNVVVSIHEQAVEMVAGDVRRVESSFDKFSVHNPTDVSAQVRLVVGFGEYNRLIVQGEMNVSAYVRSSANGVSAALPDSITKEIGLDNNVPVVRTSGAVITTSPAVANSMAVFLWDDEFYAVTQTHLYQLDKENTGVFVSSTVLSTPLPSTAVGAAVNSRGEIFVHSNQQIVKLDFAGNNFGSVINMGGLFEGVGGASVGDKVYFLTLSVFGPPIDVWNIFEYDTVTGDWRSVPDPVNHGNVLGMRDGVLYRHGFGASGGFPVDINTLEVGVVAVLNVMVGGQAQTAFSPMDDLAATGNNTDFSVREATDITHYGKIWVQEVGDASTRRYLALLEEYVWYPRNGKTVMVGAVLKAILAATERAYDSDYLDRIVSISYYDGLNTHLISSGTQSWALRGLKDELHLALDSEITIEILPPF